MKRDQHRQALVDACLELLQTQSCEEISLRHVASAAGVSLGRLTRRFPNKSALFEACLDSAYKKLSMLVGEHVLKFLQSGDLDTALDHIIEDGLRVALERPDLARLRVLTRVGARDMTPAETLERLRPYADVAAMVVGPRIGAEEAKLSVMSFSMVVLRYASHSPDDLAFICGETDPVAQREVLGRHLRKFGRRILSEA